MKRKLWEGKNVIQFTLTHEDGLNFSTNYKSYKEIATSTWYLTCYFQQIIYILIPVNKRLNLHRYFPLSSKLPQISLTSIRLSMSEKRNDNDL